MQLKTILNRVQKHQSFIYADMELKERGSQLELNIAIRPRRNSRPVCSGCGSQCAGYDTLPERRFEFIPFWGHSGVFCLCDASGQVSDLRHQG